MYNKCASMVEHDFNAVQLPLAGSDVRDIQVLWAARVCHARESYLNHDAICHIPVHILCAGHQHCSKCSKG